MRVSVALVVIGLLVGLPLVSAQADGAEPFVTAKQLDLSLVLPPPSPVDSDEMKGELAELLKIQATRTPDQVAQAQGDAELTVWRFADVLGPHFTKEALPKVAALFDRVVATEGAVVDPAKDLWKRPRPHMVSAEIKPVVRLTTSGSYPSGHATLGALMGILLAEMVPEKREAIQTRSRQFAENRMVAGIHFRSDVVAGRIAGSAIAFRILPSDAFQALFQPAKTELRAALGLGD
jgi:acid phosphatase (class A)